MFFGYHWLRAGPLNLILVIVASSALNAQANTWFQPCSIDDVDIFQSDFQNTPEIIPDADGNFAEMRVAVPALTCAKRASKSTFSLGYGRIQYQQGDEDQRYARITSAPADAENKVLEFTIKRPNVNVGEKGRVQMVVYGGKSVKAVNAKVRLYIPEHLELLRRYPKPINWLTLAEWWNNDNWSGDLYPFRISINLVKPGTLDPQHLVFRISAETYSYFLGKWTKKVWVEQANHFNVPTGKWITLEYAIVEGNNLTGRFFMSATPDGGERVTLVNVRNYTHHPLDPAPDGISDFNPIKLYTSGDLIKYIAGKGSALTVLWDDLRLTACRGWYDCIPDSAPTPPAGPKAQIQ